VGLPDPPLAARAEVVELWPVLVEKAGAVGVEYWPGKARVARPTAAAPAALLTGSSRVAPPLGLTR
jgi:hypothetical protein